MGIDKEKVGMVLFDRGTKFTKLYASAREAAKADKFKLLYADGAPEIVKAGKAMEYHHDTSTPYRSATNGVAERR
eukprot:15392074-Heterocapsa_arctica.AAC.1